MGEFGSNEIHFQPCALLFPILEKETSRFCGKIGNNNAIYYCHFHLLISAIGRVTEIEIQFYNRTLENCVEKTQKLRSSA
jgi:hypothetical protein